MADPREGAGGPERVGSEWPLYAAVYDEILRLVSEGVYPVGSQLVGEPEFARQLGVSRVVLREAIRALEVDGILIKRAGIGTFVNEPYPIIESSLTTNYGMTEIIESGGLAAGTASIAITEEKLDAKYAARLEQPVGTWVRKIERVRTAAGRPVALTVDYVPVLSCRSSCEELAEGGSLYDLLESWGIVVRNGYARLIPTKAGHHVGKALGISAESIVLLIEQVDCDEDGRVVMFSEEYHVRTAFRFLVRRVRGTPERVSSSRDGRSVRTDDQYLGNW
ncbi:MAG: GntR family transcriptional regulator [Acidimicrobiales bacterium]|jgi:GntR family transcriptional regulator